MNNVNPAPQKTCDDWREHYEENRGLIGWVISRHFGWLHGNPDLLDDAWQIGALALVSAAQKRDRSKGLFSSYAKRYIFGFLSNYFAADWIIRVPRSGGGSRRPRRPRRISGEFRGLPDYLHPATYDPDPDEYEEPTLDPAIEAAISRLPARYKTVVERVFFVGESLAEINQGREKKNAGRFLHLGLKQLRADLESQGVGADAFFRN